jgi:hypothetical protein
VIEQAIVFMVAVSLPLMLVVEQIACWRSGLAGSDEPRGHEDRGVVPSLPPRSRAGAMFHSTGTSHEMAPKNVVGEGGPHDGGRPHPINP